MRLFSWFGAALVAASLTPHAVSAQAAKFDGTWSVLVVTEKGGCDQAYRYPVVIQGGEVRYGGPEAFDVSGKVGTNGAINARIARGNAGANVNGRLAGNLGSGTWVASSGSGACSGRWEAEKRS
jgi:hypothetical protein